MEGLPSKISPLLVHVLGSFDFPRRYVILMLGEVCNEFAAIVTIQFDQFAQPAFDVIVVVLPRGLDDRHGGGHLHGSSIMIDVVLPQQEIFSFAQTGCLRLFWTVRLLLKITPIVKSFSNLLN